MQRKVLLIIGIIIMVISIIFILKDDDNTKNVNKTPSELKEDTENVINQIIDPSTTMESIDVSVGKDSLGRNLILGENSELKLAPSDKMIEKNALQQYVKEQEIIANKVETEFLKNLNYSIINTDVISDTEVIQTIEVVGFYYELLITDWMDLANYLCEQAGVDLSDLEKNQKTQVSFYKAKVKALQLIEPFISNYENYGEKIEFYITYVNGEPKDSSEMLTLILNIRGMTYDNMNFSKEENVRAQQERLKTYISNGYATGILQEGKLLEL